MEGPVVRRLVAQIWGRYCAMRSAGSQRLELL